MILLTIFLLTFTFSIPHTISIRLFFETVLVLIAIKIYFSKNKIEINKPSMFVLTMIIWCTIHSLLISQQKFYSLQELNSQKLRPFLLFITVYILSQNTRWKIILWAFIAGLTSIVFFHFFSVVYQAIVIKSIPWQYTIVGNEKHDISLITNLTYGVWLSTFIANYSKFHYSKLTKLSLLILFLAFFVFLTIQINARNGIIGFLGITTTILFFTMYSNFFLLKKQFQILLITIISTSFVGVFMLSIKTDSRWKYFYDSVSYALTINTFTDYKNVGAIPPHPENKAIDGSAFERTLMLKEGIIMSVKYPWGYGVGRATYDTMMKNDFGVGRQQSTHSGILDWTLELGYLGLILWICFLYSVLKFAFIEWKNYKNYYSLISCIFIIGFFSRSLIEAIVMRTHFFEMYMMILGILSARITRFSFGIK